MKCKDCRYWNASIFVDDDVEIGECRRKPPKLSIKLAQKPNNLSCTDEAHWLATVFPITDDHMWCGKWKEREK